MDINKKVNKFAKSEGFDYAEGIGQYNGFDVFVAGYNDGCDIGLPQYILALNDDIRWASTEETKIIMASGLI